MRKNGDSIDILNELGLSDILKKGLVKDISEETVDCVYGKLNQDLPYKPRVSRLAKLAEIIIKTGRTTILEFGCGWSSLVFAASLERLKNFFREFDLKKYRRNDWFQCFSVDNEIQYINIAKSRIPKVFEDRIHFYYSKVQMVLWNGRIATEYQRLVNANPDFIYLDGPDQFKVDGDINGWSTRANDMVPMACDVLKMEYFLIPKTIIVVDGRGANVRFLRNHFQRNWDHYYDEDLDQHYLFLDEEPFGRISRDIIQDLYYREGEWRIQDLI